MHPAPAYQARPGRPAGSPAEAKAAAAPRAGALSSLRVVELAGLGPCPLAGQMLADHGAEVCILDRRSAAPEPHSVNRRGKRTIAADLKTPGGVEIARRLIARADVLIEGYRPGVMERLGLGPDVALTLNPRLVYGRMTGWGQDGPYATSAGHDLTYLALTGALHAMGRRDAPPTPPLNLVADYGGGAMMLLFGVLAALVERAKSGRGQVVNAAMTDGVAALMGLLHGKIASGAMTADREANMLDGGAPYYRCYETRDGRYIAVGAIEPGFYAELLRLTGLPAAWLAQQNERSHWAAQIAEFAAVFRSRDRDDWRTVFAGSDACVAPVLDWHEAVRDPHAAARGTFRELAGVWQAAPAPRLDRTPAATPPPPAGPGADTDVILGELGFAGTEIAEFRRAGALT
ncbi:CaiB/BaiF CoA transferase family protein [Roseivivax sp. CAU 1761]